MRKAIIGLTLAGLSLAACDTADDKKAARKDAPFGLAMGDLIPDIQIGSTPDASGYATMRSVPEPEVPFVDYAVIVRENIGICRVLAASGDFAMTNGAAVRGRVDDVRKRVEAQYGKPTRIVDTCKGDRLCTPSGWTYAIAQGARQYGFYWGGDGKMLTPTIKEIRLEAKTSKSVEPYVRIDYIFANEAACAAATPPATKPAAPAATPPATAAKK